MGRRSPAVPGAPLALSRRSFGHRPRALLMAPHLFLVLLTGFAAALALLDCPPAAHNGLAGCVVGETVGKGCFCWARLCPPPFPSSPANSPIPRAPLSAPGHRPLSQRTLVALAVSILLAHSRASEWPRVVTLGCGANDHEDSNRLWADYCFASVNAPNGQAQSTGKGQFIGQTTPQG